MTNIETHQVQKADRQHGHEAEPQRVYAYLAPRGNFTHLAMLDMVRRPEHESTVLLGVGSIDEMFESIITGKATHALIPIENSTDGPVPKSHKNLFDREVQIIGEESMPIIPSVYFQDQARVRKVASKDSALGQCRQHIKDLFTENVGPGEEIELIEMESTGDAVALATKDPTVAAIGSSISAREQEIHNLLQIDNFNDKDLNATTFALIQRPGELPAPTGNDKTTFIMTIEDSKGKLVDALGVLATRGVDLNKIKSINKTPDSVSFLVSVDGHELDSVTGDALNVLEASGVSIKKLGSYPKAETAKAQPNPKSHEKYDFDAATQRIYKEAKNGDALDKNKRIVVFTLIDKPGALLSALKPFADAQVNLTKIDSQPSGIPNEHIFYLAFDNKTEGVPELIAELETHCHYVAELERVA